VLSITPQLERFALTTRALAGHSPVEFGGGCLPIWNDGVFVHEESMCAVPEGRALVMMMSTHVHSFRRVEADGLRHAMTALGFVV
jgi:Rps23 Pro-64 3,4-dihydroxylase Tpa1-like proline 4-hydroxylase